MSSQASYRWSLSLGSCWGFGLRLHASLLALVVLVLAVTARGELLGGLILLAVVLISAVLHELAHQVIALRLMGVRQSIQLTPIGGLRMPSVPNDPEVQLLVGMVGPLVNLAIVVLSAGLLAYTTDSLDGVFSLTGPVALFEGSWRLVTLKATLWINWLIFLVSLIPTFPFDGGPALRATLWPLLGQRTAHVVCAQLARLVGLSLAVAAALVLQGSPSLALSLAAPLGLLAVMVVCSAQHDLATVSGEDDILLGGLLEHTASPVGARRAPSDQGGLRLDEVSPSGWPSPAYDSADEPDNEDVVVDEILARLHTHGPKDLSDEDRRVLQRASRRYRDRRRDGAR